MTDGFITIERKILNWEWYKDSNMLHLFIYLLLRANFEESRFKGNIINRGQLVFGRKEASKDTGISEQSIRTCIERLKSTNELTIESTSQYSIITICKYEEYQIKNKKSTSKSTSKSTLNQPATNHVLTSIILEDNTNKERNKGIDEIFEKWVEYRVKIKKPIHPASMELAKKKLHTLSNSDTKIALLIIEQSIENGWQGLFSLKNPPIKESGFKRPIPQLSKPD